MEKVIHERVIEKIRTSKTVSQLHDDIEGALGVRAEHRMSSETLKSNVKRKAQVAWRFMKRHPFLAMGLIGASGITLAAEVGMAELAFGGALALAAYKVLREGEPPMTAVEDVAREVRG